MKLHGKVALLTGTSPNICGGTGAALGRLPSPADFAKAAVFLASDEAAMITGADLKVDAGALARYWRSDPSVPPP